MTAIVAPGVRFGVVEIHCRHCKARIDVEIAKDLTPVEQLRECERQAEAKHVCPAKDDFKEPEEPAVP